MLKIDLPKDYKLEELEMLMSVANQLGIEIKDTVHPMPGQYKVIKGTAVCQLCKTVTVQLIKLSKYSNGVWMKERDFAEEEEIDPEKLEKAQEIKAKVQTCWACIDTLLKRDKIDLVNIIINSRTVITTRQEIWKYITELRSAPVAEPVIRKRKERKGEDG
jgi:hypothetical protein